VVLAAVAQSLLSGGTERGTLAVPAVIESVLTLPESDDVNVTSPPNQAGSPSANPDPTMSSPQASVATTTAPSNAPTTSPAGVGGSVEVLSLLAFIAVEEELEFGYDDSLFFYAADLDGDGCDTRAEVLQAESLSPAQVDYPGCDVRAGDWVSLYDGLAFTDDTEMQVDHVVALKEAWDSGAWDWLPLYRVLFANDLDDARTLRAVSALVNQQKGAKDPTEWMPPDPSAVCTFIADWVAVKVRWSLSMDSSEHLRIKELLTTTCSGTRTGAVTPVSVLTVTGAAGGNIPDDTVPQRPFVPLPPSGDESQSTSPPVYDVYFRSCAAARAAGAAPLYVGEPGYRSGLDRDGDGVACE